MEDVYVFEYGEYDRSGLRVIEAFLPDSPNTVVDCKEKLARVEHYFGRLVLKGNDGKFTIDEDVAYIAKVQALLVEKLAQLRMIEEGLGRVHPSLQTLMAKRLGASKYD